jgi:predicted acyl esterase
MVQPDRHVALLPFNCCCGTLSEVTDVARRYTILRDVLVPMRDGVGLATDVYLPEGSRPFPTLLQRTPYDKSAAFGGQYIVGMEIIRALDAGFAGGRPRHPRQVRIFG